MLLAFHNDPAIKEKFINRVKKHQELDNFRKGFYWKEGKGCAVGCTLEMDGGYNNIYEEYEKQLGIPRGLPRLKDEIFEGLSVENNKQWPLDFLTSIRVGADLSNILKKFSIWLLEDEKYGIIQYSYRSNLGCPGFVAAITDLAVRAYAYNDAAALASLAARAYAAEAGAGVLADISARNAAEKKISKIQAEKLIELLKAA